MTDHKTVPREPTLRMMEAGSDAADSGKLTYIWRAMYDAAPTINDCTPDDTCGMGAIGAAQNALQPVVDWLHKWPGGAPNEVWSAVSEAVAAAAKINEGGQECVREAADSGSDREPVPPSPDLVERLRKCYAHWGTFPECAEAADAIERLSVDLATAHAACRNYENEARIAATERDALRAEVEAEKARFLPLVNDNDALRAEMDKYHDALVDRHGGEPIALLSELDESRG